MLEPVFKPYALTMPSRNEVSIYGEYYPSRQRPPKPVKDTYGNVLNPGDKCYHMQHHRVEWDNAKGERLVECVSCHTSWKNGKRLGEGGLYLRKYVDKDNDKTMAMFADGRVRA